MTIQSFARGATGYAIPIQLVETMSQRVTNDYTDAISSLAAAAAATPNPSARAVLWETAARLRNKADTHFTLQPPPTDEEINLADYLGQVCAALTKALLAERGVRLALEADDIWISSQGGWRVALIVSELVREAARRTKEAEPGAIGIRLFEDRGQVSCLVYHTAQARTQPPHEPWPCWVGSLAAALGASVDAWRTLKGSVVHVQVSAAPSGAADSPAADLNSVAGQALYRR
jgi:hypothetical protein